MLPVGWLVVAVVLAIVLSMWITFTLTRLDRLHARVDAARAALDAQLVRRAAALLHVAETAQDHGLDAVARVHYEAVAQHALTPDGPHRRETVENRVGRAVAELAEGGTALGAEADAELREAAARVQVARRFYNDAVRDTRALRSRRMPRVLHLAGRVALPEFFDIDDTLPREAPRPMSDACGANLWVSPRRETRIGPKPDPSVASGRGEAR